MTISNVDSSINRGRWTSHSNIHISLYTSHYQFLHSGQAARCSRFTREGAGGKEEDAGGRASTHVDQHEQPGIDIQ